VKLAASFDPRRCPDILQTLRSGRGSGGGRGEGRGRGEEAGVLSSDCQAGADKTVRGLGNVLAVLWDGVSREREGGTRGKKEGGKDGQESNSPDQYVDVEGGKDEVEVEEGEAGEEGEEGVRVDVPEGYARGVRETLVANYVEQLVLGVAGAEGAELFLRCCRPLLLYSDDGGGRKGEETARSILTL
jgi:hypothetical protein